MNSISGSVPSASTPSRTRWVTLAAGSLVALAVLAAYRNSFEGAFVFDDFESIVTNPTIRHLWPLGPVLSPPGGGATVTGRPFLNLSFAVNYALSGVRPWSYHALNLAIHILAGLTLFGIIRRTLPYLARARGSPPGGEGGLAPVKRAAPTPTLLALSIALTWALHPLQTEAVAYVAQRAESLMGLFYLLTLYCFIRYADEETKIGPPSPVGLRRGGFRIAKAGGRQRFVAGWAVLSTFACLLGMATKEVMVSAPILVLLYDRTFVSGSFSGAWRRHGPLYWALSCTWILLAFEVAASAGRGGTAGFGGGISWWSYLLTQFSAVVHYLRLAIWPQPLIFDYGSEWVSHSWTALAPAALVVVLIVGTVWALFRSSTHSGGFRLRHSLDGPDVGRILGFAGAWFFLILAPSSSVVPVTTQTIAEHRMYLPLAAVVALVAAGLIAWAGWRGLIALFAAAAALGWASARRIQTYRSDIVLWSDTVAKLPNNERAQYALADALRHAGRPAEAVAHYQEAVRLRPDYLQAYNNLGIALVEAGRLSEAAAIDEEALRLDPDFFDARYNLAKTLFLEGRRTEAIDDYRSALRLKPDRAEVHDDLGIALHQSGRTREAIAEYEEALRLRPEYAEADFNLGNALARLGRWNEAIARYEQALRLRPDFAEARSNLALARRLAGQTQP